MYRHFPQTASYFSNNGCEVKNPVKTSDGGYVFGYLFWILGFEFPGGPTAYYTIKTDSNFVPQWKKPDYSSAIALPTGGIILVTNSSVEKVTASGVQVWRKEISSSIVINEGVTYSNKIRLVGKKAGLASINIFWVYRTSEAYTCLMDTSSGGLISQSIYSPSYSNGFSEFSKIERDQQGNFFVYSSPNDLNLPVSNMNLAKFDSSFTFLWGKTLNSSSQSLYLTDIDILPNGRIFGTGLTNYGAGVLLKLDSQGNIISQSSFSDKWKITGLCKKQNGNYLVSITSQDSLFMFETDTSMNISWNKFCARGRSIGASVIENNKIITPLFYGYDPVLISNDLNGNSCTSLALPYSQFTTSLSLVNFTLSPLTYTATVSSGTINSISTQSYVDSCKCSPFILVNQNNLCVGNIGTINISGTGNLSWYSTATGNSFIQPGSQFIYSSNTPTVKTVYAQDSACGANPNRTQINITVYAIPSLTFSPLNPTICTGSQVFVYALGANNYTWSGFSNNSYVKNLNPPSTTHYTVSGSVAPGCSDTKTMSVFVVSPPTLAITPATNVCVGSTATISVSGANTYTWNTLGSNNSSFTVYAASPGQTLFNVVGAIGYCYSYMQTTLSVSGNPTLSLLASPASICPGQSSTLAASGANTYTWNTSALTNSILVTPASNTNYIVYGANGVCVKIDTINVTVYPNPTVIVSVSAPNLCLGESLSLLATGAQFYNWSNGLTSNLVTQTPSVTTNYIVTGANAFGCTDQKNILVTVHPLPIITLVSSSPTLCVGQSSTLTASGASTYSWNSIAGNSGSIVSPLVNSTYTVTVTDTFGCTNSATIAQYVDECTGLGSLIHDEDLIVISPNPTHGLFSLHGSSINEKTRIEIYNSIGQFLWSQTIIEQNSVFSIENFTSGIYYIKVSGLERPLTLKMVKQ